MNLRLGDCLDVLRELDAGSVDAVVTDPPYGIGFMGREWDSFSPDAVAAARAASLARKETFRTSERWPSKNGKRRRQNGGVPIKYDFSARGTRGFQAWCETWATECLRVLKPGGHLASFGGTRTYHRLAAGVEDAGFEIRDTLCWLFGSGFPKSRNLTGDWQGWGTALKPGYEPIVLARKPLAGTVAANVAEHSTGALNIAGCSIPITDRADYERNASGDRGHDGTRSTQERTATDMRMGGGSASEARWPANVLLDEAAAELLDEQSGFSRDGVASGRSRGFARDGYVGGTGSDYNGDPIGYGGAGGASRFFYCAKASRAERNAGLDGSTIFSQEALPERIADPYGEHRGRRMDDKSRFDGEPAAIGRNHHPTVKPIALMRWLIRLVTPAGGLVLDPFLGSGTTGIAASLEGVQFIGVEREPDYMRIARARISHWACTEVDVA